MSSSIHFYISEFLEEQAYRGNAEATMTYYRERLTRFVRDSAAEVLDDFEERRRLAENGTELQLWKRTPGVYFQPSLS